MNSETPLDFHRRRVTALADTLGLWRQCRRAACRRAGACRGADEPVPFCVLAVVQGVSRSVRVCVAALPGAEPRLVETESTGAQLDRINRRMGALLEQEIERVERMNARRTERDADHRY
jgi:hypothetical protein